MEYEDEITRLKREIKLQKKLARKIKMIGFIIQEEIAKITLYCGQIEEFEKQFVAGRMTIDDYEFALLTIKKKLNRSNRYVKYLKSKCPEAF